MPRRVSQDLRGPLRLAAWLGLFAVLFQAILFGWHHHDLPFAGHLPAPILENHAGTPQPADDADGCEICQVLHHLTAAPIDVAGTAPPLAVASASIAVEAPFLAHTFALAFRARAPPRLTLPTV
jgi:hypothetical protein